MATAQEILDWLGTIGPFQLKASETFPDVDAGGPNIQATGCSVVITTKDARGGFNTTDGTGVSILEALSDAKDEADAMGLDAGLDPARIYERPPAPRRHPRGKNEPFNPPLKGS